MKKVIIVGLVVVGIVLSGKMILDSQTKSEDVSEKITVEKTYPEGDTSNIDAATVGYLEAALQDEYHAEAVYKKVIDNFGEVKPFSNIIFAEQTHSGRIEALMGDLELDIPENEWANKEIASFATVQLACETGVEAEIANVDLYDSFLDEIQNEDVKMVLTALRNASEESHLPAFERCAIR